MKSRFLILGLAASALCVFPVKAELLNFDFTLVSNPGSSTVNGAVSGEIFGLENNGTSTPSDIILTSIPVGFGFAVPPVYSLKNNGWSLAGDSQGAFFTVNSGAITSTTDFEASLLSQNAYLSFNVPFISGQRLNGFQFGSNYSANTYGFTGVTYTPVAAPEPSSWMLTSLGLLGLLAMGRARGPVRN